MKIFNRRWIWACIGLFGITFVTMLLGAFTFAPQKTMSALPPRPTVQPAAVPSIDGAAIQLLLANATTGVDGVWTIVQWKEADGDWHDVEGWQGTVELDGMQTWWVDGAQLGNGPFRWRVYTEKDGEPLAISEDFYLPERARTVSTIAVEVD